MELQELSPNEITGVNGGILGHIAITIAIADAAYEFYKGYRDHRE